ncbi:MAG: cytochrome c-type biogenesis CcmF C-terminal domain-containing protein [Halobacteriota archaeon]|nr:cytochrome c-type biogenesis CcmF C-terminal domain-containing protein [Halobacteriota archaeon]
MIGYISLVLAIIVSVLTMLSYAYWHRSHRREFIEVGRNGVYIICGLLSFASIWLFYLLFTRDFQNIYVWGYTSNDLSWFYTFSAFWAGKEGSLLLWSWMLSIMIALVVRRSKNDKFITYATPILVGINIAFLIVLVFISNPFERTHFIPTDGFGMNPVLQDPGMVIHPPVLFLGYAGFAIPFAYVLAGLLSGDDTWNKRSRYWVLVSWISLGLGISLGGWWSYHVLGWGGYWAWDPVENASLLPWLISTALLHSMIIQDKRDGLKVTNILLGIFTFILIIYGTFLTRSGVLSSVHAYAESQSAIFYLGFIAVLLITALGVLISRYKTIQSKELSDSILSKDTSFLVNVIIFVVLTLVVFLGTIYPLISELFTGSQVDVGLDYYNSLSVPVGGFLILLIGVCPMLAWKRTSSERLKSSFMYPTIISLFISVIAFALGIRHFYAVCTAFISTFTLSTHFMEFLKAARSDERYSLDKLLKAVGKNHRKYGGYVVHIAIVIMVIGIIGSSVYDTEVIKMLDVGESYDVDEYRLVFEGVRRESDISKMSQVAGLSIYEGEKLKTVATPSIDIYSKFQDQSIKRVYIHGTVAKDIYIIYEGSEGSVSLFTIRTVPLISLIWFGTLVMFLGTILALAPDTGTTTTSSESSKYDNRFEKEFKKFKEGKK